MGCGRVGAHTATHLDTVGHSVAVIDRNPDAFRRLGTSFGGTMIEGIGFDKETLEAADITEAYAFASVSSGDNSNILSARTAREVYGVPHVVARIYDPRRAAVYQRMGIPTVATVNWTSDQILRRMLPAGTSPHYTDNSGTIHMTEITIHRSWVGHSVSSLEKRCGARIAFLSRLGEGMLPTPDTLLQDGDVAFVVMYRDDESIVEAVISGDRAPQ